MKKATIPNHEPTRELRLKRKQPLKLTGDSIGIKNAIDLIVFEASFQTPNVSKMCDEINISPGTYYRFVNRKVRSPHFRTTMSLLTGFGYEVNAARSS